MNDEKLEAIAEQSAENLKALLIERKDEIRAAIATVIEQSQEDETDKAVLNLTHQIKLDLGKEWQTDSLAFSVRRKSEVGVAIPDPNQPELDM